VNIALTLLYLLVLPYLGLMLMVIAGMLRREESTAETTLPGVSVIIPAHNEEVRLAATLRSLAAQHYLGEVEFLIVDDRSADSTGAIIDAFVQEDARFRKITVTSLSRRLSPKVNAVNEGIHASESEIIITSDADCEYPPGWISELVRHFTPDVVMVVGYVESTRAYQARNWVERFESTDWLSLMLTSRSLTRFGWKFASSANNQAYRRSAFEAVGGFGASGRAPSGDEDLLTQRLGRLEGSRLVFASTPASRVLTRPMPSLPALLRQRRRWVSRYHHSLHYQPAFLLSIATLGLQSVALTIALLLLPFFPAATPWVLGLWAVKLLIELTGMAIGTKQLDRRDLWFVSSFTWALLHPLFIAVMVISSLVRPADWRGGTSGYRTRYYRRQWQLFSRRLRARFAGEGRA
jgi:cellulose synthase/poly-beta-1,6-N-acetylglucosamine synthase-like glycosyltransferase